MHQARGGAARARCHLLRRPQPSLYSLVMPLLMRFHLPLLILGLTGVASGAQAFVPPPATCADTIRVLRADYVDTLQVPDRAKPTPLGTIESGGGKIEILGYFPEIIVRQNGRIILFGLLDDTGVISKIYTKEPKATMQIAPLGDKSQTCLIVRWEEAVQEGDGEAMYKVVQVWDVARHVCLANERWAAAAGPVGSTLAGKPPVGCTADVSVTGGKLVIGEKQCPPGAAAQPKVAVRVDAPGTYALVGGRLSRCK